MRLPFELKTIANTYQPEAFVSGIVFSRGGKHMPYFLSNYIRIVYDTDAIVLLKFYVDNFLLMKDGLINMDYASIIMQYAIQRVDFSELARRALDNHRYVFGAFNDGCIPGKSAYPDRYFWHDYLLYGYEGEEFISAAYLSDGHYREFRINMQDYNRAMIIKESDIFIYMLDYDEDSALGFDLAMVRSGLEDYLTSRKLEEGSALYGLKAIRQFAEDVKNEHSGRLDSRYFCFISEHKNLMRLRLRYMQENGYINLSEAILKEYDRLADSCKKSILLALKYNITGEKGILERLAQTITESAEQDERVLSEILERL